MTRALAVIRSAPPKRAALENLRTLVTRARSEVDNAESLRQLESELPTPGRDQQLRAGRTTIADRAAPVARTPVPSTSSTG
jgi:hypothetical protein